MVKVQRIVLDVLKPHSPNSLEFSTMLADKCPGCWLNFKVSEVDEKTETLEIEIIANEIDFEVVQAAITEIGGSLHSIDQVEVLNESSTE